MSARALEAFLTRIYVDAAARARFKADPRAEAQAAGLSDEECTALENTDWIGLEMAARSLARKRKLKRENHRRNSFSNTLENLFTTIFARFGGN
jgi:Aromatic-ring-opening dioxygenase LigAB, LigA subunit